MIAGFATLRQYLEHLPEGLDSFPQLTAKGSVVRAFLNDAQYPLATGCGLPPRLDELIRAPPASSDWVREVELWAIAAAVYDVNFAARGGIAAFTEWSYGANRRLLRGPAYRILFSVLSPERLFVGATQRWSAFHRGTQLSDVEVSKGAGSVRLVAAPHAIPEIGRVAFAMAFRAALDLAGAEAVDVTSRSESPAVSLFQARWR